MKFYPPVVIDLPERLWFTAEGVYGASKSRWGSVRTEDLYWDNAGVMWARGVATNKDGLGKYRREVEIEMEYLPWEVALYVGYRLLEALRETTEGAVVAYLPEMDLGKPVAEAS